MRRRSLLLSVATVGLLAGCDGSGDADTTQTTLTLTSTNYVTQPTVAPTTAASTIPGQPAPAGDEQIYTVVSGDYPFKVAEMFGVSWDEIKAYNGWTTDGQFPFPGGEVKIPPGAQVPSSTTATETTTGGDDGGDDTTPTEPESTTTTIDTSGMGTYVIAEGDIPIKVAENFDITLDQLAAANGWDANNPGSWPFIVGNEIKIPEKAG